MVRLGVEKGSANNSSSIEFLFDYNFYFCFFQIVSWAFWEVLSVVDSIRNILQIRVSIPGSQIYWAKMLFNQYFILELTFCSSSTI